jgi:hypothetical protein
MSSRGRIAASTLGALVIACAIAPGASAAKPALTLETAAGPLAEGAEIVLSSSDMRLVSTSGNDECTKNVLTGTVVTNSAGKDAITVSSTSFTGEGFKSESICFDSDPLGPVELTGAQLPWPLTLTTKGAATMKGTKKVEIAEKHIDAENATCFFAAGKLAASFAQVGKTGEPLSLLFSAQTLKTRFGKEGSNRACPNAAKLSGHFSATSNGETVLAHT